MIVKKVLMLLDFIILGCNWLYIPNMRGDQGSIYLQ